MHEMIRPEDEAAMERSIEILQPLDVAKAEEVLKEVKQIFDKHGVTFFLRKGTCLGAVRDKGLIPWDDDLDVGSVIGFHGLTEKSIDQVAASFRESGFITKVDYPDYAISVTTLKPPVRADWMIHRIIDDSTFHWPGVRIPARLFNQLKEIDFLGEKFQVPNPPEEYLGFMYGSEWAVPKKRGSYEKDVVDLIPMDSLPGRARKGKQFIVKHLLPWLATRIKVLDATGEPVAGAEVVVAGLGRTTTNGQGYARFCIPYSFIYSLILRFEDHEEVLYEENLSPGKKYVYQADDQTTSGRIFTLTSDN
ncbi:MAG: LicD family protein [Dehalococcoidales bacterium]|jgi:hypothetical protein|nr:LicD family protein [Dehalococcoidales bacterium]